jgi:hypothetical protein
VSQRRTILIRFAGALEANQEQQSEYRTTDTTEQLRLMPQAHSESNGKQLFGFSRRARAERRTAQACPSLDLAKL